MSQSQAIAILLVTAALSVPKVPAQEGAPVPTPEATPVPAATPGITPEPFPPQAPDCLTQPLDASERDTLLRLAWRTLAGHLDGNPIKDADLEAYPFTPCLVAPRGLFVTLKKAGQVRGMQGEIDPSRPLYQQVIVFTRRAATRDPRFLPLTDRDLEETTIELALIGVRTRVAGSAEIQTDRQGVFLEKWGRRALFLPGLAAQQGWTAERTLDELCSQAALPKGSWAESARIEVFGTEVVAGSQPAKPAPSPPLPSPEASPAPSGTAPAARAGVPEPARILGQARTI